MVAEKMLEEESKWGFGDILTLRSFFGLLFRVFLFLYVSVWFIGKWRKITDNEVLFFAGFVFVESWKSANKSKFSFNCEFEDFYVLYLFYCFPCIFSVNKQGGSDIKDFSLTVNSGFLRNLLIAFSMYFLND